MYYVNIKTMLQLAIIGAQIFEIAGRGVVLGGNYGF